MKLRMYLVTMIAVMFSVFMFSSVYAGGNASVYMGNGPVDLSQIPIAIDGTDYVPVGSIFKALGLEFNWSLKNIKIDKNKNTKKNYNIVIQDDGGLW